MKKTILFALLTVMATMFSLTSATAQDSATSSDEDKMYKEMGIDICECTTPLLEIGKKAEKLDENDMEELAKLLQEVEEETKKMEACMESVAKKYPKIDFKVTDNPKAEKAIMDNCPALKEMADTAKKAQKEME